jgi:drug/metabolite transporter (DMT)-like permease
VSAPRLRASVDWRVLVCLAIVYVVWGSTYLAIRVMVHDVPPFFAAGARFVVAGAIVTILIAATRGLPAFRVRARELVAASLAGLLILVGGIGLLTVAERTVPSALAALLIASVPLWTVLLQLATRETISRRTLAAAGVGFVSVFLLLAPTGGSLRVSLSGSLLVVAAAVLTAIGAFVSNRMQMPENPLVSAAIEMVLGGCVLLALSLAAAEPIALEALWTGSSGTAFWYLVVAGSVVAYSAFVWLLENAPISLVVTYAYVNPAVAVLLGVTLASERLTPLRLAGAAVLLASVFLTVREEARRRERGSPAGGRSDE